MQLGFPGLGPLRAFVGRRTRRWYCAGSGKPTDSGACPVCGKWLRRTADGRIPNHGRADA